MSSASRIRLRLTAVAALTVFAFACADGPTEAPLVDQPVFAKAAVGDAAETILATMNRVNEGLAAEGTEYRVVWAEYITGVGDEVGNIVITKHVGNKQLEADFVPFDSRRGWSGPVGGATDDITYAIDRTADAVPFFGGLTGAQTDAAIVRAMNTWDAEQCSDLPLSRNPDLGWDIGVVRFFDLAPPFSSPPFVDGSPFVFADIQHAGWRDINFPGGILGVTFTFNFCDPCGDDPVFTDINNDRKLDVAFREIYYDPSFFWADDGVSNVDVETIALHEVGHGLSQAHFGKIFITKNGKLHFAPHAVMNAFYFAPQRTLLGTDNGGHCSIWASWPNN